MHDVVRRHPLYRIPGFAPCGQPADNHERVKSPFPQQVRHTGAGRFARSSAIQIDVFVSRKYFDFLRKIIRFQPNRSLNARGARIVVAVAAHIGQ